MTDRAPTQTIPLGRVDKELFIFSEKKKVRACTML